MRQMIRRAGRKIRGCARASILLAAVSLGSAAVAQNGPTWVLIADGNAAVDIEGTHEHASPDAAAEAALAMLHDDGFLRAEVDSVRAEEGVGTVFVRRGERVVVRSIEVVGTSLIDLDLLKQSFTTQPGTPFSASALAEDSRRLLRALDAVGRPLAGATLGELHFDDDHVDVVIEIDEGPALVLSGLDLGPESRTDPGFAARLVGLRAGAALASYDPAALRRSLEATGLFTEVGTPELSVNESNEVLIIVPVEEAQPGAVDLALGYLPPSPGVGGQLVGSGTLALRNLFGRARSVHLQLVRNPGLVSSIDIAVSDPFVLGLPLRLEGGFSGYQQDSTFNRQSLRIEAGYRMAPGLEVVASGSREVVEAGIGGDQVIGGRLRVPDANAWYAGLGLRFERVDRILNPRSGLAVSTMFEQGAKRRELEAGSEEPVTVQRQRLHSSARLFIPTFTRQALVVGADASIVLGEDHDDSDLVRIGGATSLRGYDEERFRGNIVGRGLAEYRYQLDPTSFAFVFFDLGYIRSPETAGSPADKRLAPGYGVGLQYQTPLGLATASFGMNPDDGPTRGNVHVGLSIGL